MAATLSLLSPEVLAFIRENVVARFVRYCQIETTSSAVNERDVAPLNASGPSTDVHWNLLRLLEQELRTLGLTEVSLSSSGYVYATLPASGEQESAPRFALLSHVDTSPEQSGKDVQPRVISNWDGSPIRYPDDPDLQLSADDDQALTNLLGDDVIVASGRTLLGADDKAGIAAMMTLAEVLTRFPEIEHAPLLLVFTRDEEIGRGVNEIDRSKLPLACYTVDGDLPGEYNTECFDAWGVKARFFGRGVHPGTAKNKLVNATVAAAHFVAALPRTESPEHTSGREGFYSVAATQANVDEALVSLIVRDYEPEKNQARLSFLQSLRERLEAEFPGLRMELEIRQSYRNMREVISKHPEVVEKLRLAITDAGLTPHETPIRGGTDGSKLAEWGHPCPNIFCGGGLAHSRKEWVGVKSMVQCVETLIHLSRHW